GALSALNYRYTHSYICACYAVSALRRSSGKTDLVADRWHIFRVTNERPYRNWAMRMFLSWSTYVPGILAGWFFILRGGYETVTFVGKFGLIATFVIVVLWITSSWRRPNLKLGLDA